MDAPFVVMAKPVGSRCNMRCTYCYYLDKGQFSSHAKQSRMRYGLLERLISETIQASPGPEVGFVWHGGEPMLAGLEFYRRAVELERKHLPRGWRVWNSLQTNGLLLSDSWCRFLRENRFSVGVSVDGTQVLHDRNRRDLGGGGTYQRVRRGIKRLQAAGVQPDLLCTVNSATVQEPLAVYRGLRELETGWIQFIPIVVPREEGGYSPESVAPEDYGAFLCAVFDEWCTHDLGKLDVQLFAETARVWAGGGPDLCWMQPVCGRAPVVEEDGGVYACDHFVESRYRLGNLLTSHLDTLLASPAQRAFGRGKRDTLTAECRRCPYLNCCGGGCPKDRRGISQDGEAGQYDLCRGLKMFFSHAQGTMERMMAWSRQGIAPQEMMRRLARKEDQ